MLTSSTEKCPPFPIITETQRMQYATNSFKCIASPKSFPSTSMPPKSPSMTPMTLDATHQPLVTYK